MNVNPYKFTRKELADFYEKLVLLWENGDLINKKFDVRFGKDYRRIKATYSFTVRCLDKVSDVEAENQIYNGNKQHNTNYICFHNVKKNLLKSYFYQLRNIAAHADFTKQKIFGCNWFVFSHSYKQQLKCYGQIRCKDFWKLRDSLLELKRKR